MAERPEPEVRTELMRVFRFNELRGKFKAISAEAEAGSVEERESNRYAGSAAQLRQSSKCCQREDHHCRRVRNGGFLLILFF